MTSPMTTPTPVPAAPRKAAKLSSAMIELLIELDTDKHLVLNTFTKKWWMQRNDGRYHSEAPASTARSLLKRGLIERDHSDGKHSHYFPTPAGLAAAPPAPSASVSDLASEGESIETPVPKPHFTVWRGEKAKAFDDPHKAAEFISAAQYHHDFHVRCISDGSVAYVPAYEWLAVYKTLAPYLNHEPIEESV